MALQSFFNTFFRAVRLRKGDTPSASSSHAQLYCDVADGALKVRLPSGSIVDLTLSGSGFMSAGYFGPDTPGTGSNTLSDGYSREWLDTGSGKAYHVTRIGATYYTVEMGSWP